MQKEIYSDSLEREEKVRGGRNANIERRGKEPNHKQPIRERRPRMFYRSISRWREFGKSSQEEQENPAMAVEEGEKRSALHLCKHRVFF